MKGGLYSKSSTFFDSFYNYKEALWKKYHHTAHVCFDMFDLSFRKGGGYSPRAAPIDPAGIPADAGKRHGC